MRLLRLALCVGLVCGTSDIAAAQSSTYRLSFSDAERHVMQVELTLADVPAVPLELHMSRSSPGRYAAHDFVRNVSDVEIADGSGVALQAVHPSAQRWRVEQPPSTVRVRYRVSGDQADGTYLAIDPTHAHINMPAALVWAKGFEQGPMTVRFDLPPASRWRIATQLWPGATSETFTAPNLQYLMDSPVELSAFALRTFTVTDGPRAPVFRLAVHHDGTDADVDALAADAERIVRGARDIFGELPAFEAGGYTFIADYLPSVYPDGMEHRNSSILTSRRPIRLNRADRLNAMTHEFFHTWNVERIRPRSLEPFDFDETNRSSELWLAEGFTQYYAPLVLVRSRLTTIAEFADDIGAMVNEVRSNPGRLMRTLEDMSRLAPLVDGASAADVSGVRATFLSYYTWGGAVALGLDLMLRDRTDGRVTLDHFMRLLWERHGKPGGRLPGYVDKPYTTADLKDALATVSGDKPFSDDFFARYIQGNQLVDYDALLRRAGLTWRSTNRGRPSLVPLENVGLTPSESQRRLRDAWLGSPAAPASAR